MMIAIQINSESGELDFTPAKADQLTWLNNAITLSLFTDARASDDDVIPDGSQDRRGYWGDIDLDDNESLGSRLWLLERSKITQDTLNTLHNYATDAVQWLIDEEHLQAINITVERDNEVNTRGNANRINFALDCQLPEGDWVSIFRTHDVSNGE